MKNVKKRLHSVAKLVEANDGPLLAADYTEFSTSYVQLLLKDKIFDQPICRSMISPNELHERFFGTKDVFIFKTEICDAISNLLKQLFISNISNINITGPIGIGKSFGLLAEVLKLRREGNIVIYFNNPKKWSAEGNSLTYLVKELIFAAMPVGSVIAGPEELKDSFKKDYLEDDINLYRWYRLLDYSSKDELTFRPVLKGFLKVLSKAAELLKKLIITVSDQENSLMGRSESGKPYASIFPYNIRDNLGEYRIYSASENNESKWKSNDPSNFSIFKRMPGLFYILFI